MFTFSVPCLTYFGRENTTTKAEKYNNPCTILLWTQQIHVNILLLHSIVWASTLDTASQILQAFPTRILSLLPVAMQSMSSSLPIISFLFSQISHSAKHFLEMSSPPTVRYLYLVSRPTFRGHYFIYVSYSLSFLSFLSCLTYCLKVLHFPSTPVSLLKLKTRYSL